MAIFWTLATVQNTVRHCVPSSKHFRPIPDEGRKTSSPSVISLMSIYGLFKYFVVYALHGYSMVLLKRNDKISSLKSGKPVTSN